MTEETKEKPLPNAAVIKWKDDTFMLFQLLEEHAKVTTFKVAQDDNFHQMGPMSMMFIDYDAESKTSMTIGIFELARPDRESFVDVPMSELAWLVEYIYNKHYKGIDIAELNPDAPHHMQQLHPH